MQLRTAAVVLSLLLMAGGCAGRSTRSNLARMQSQVSLLDERVTQLERSGWNSGTSSASGSEAPTDTTTTLPESVTTLHASRSSGAHIKVASQTSGKPGTRQIQQALKNAGFYQGNVDGKMGPVTRQAVEEFQRINGLTADGVVGRKTWQKLQAYAELSDGSGSKSPK